jgi:hypothetical protein
MSLSRRQKAFAFQLIDVDDQLSENGHGETWVPSGNGIRVEWLMKLLMITSQKTRTWRSFAGGSAVRVGFLMTMSIIMPANLTTA